MSLREQPLVAVLTPVYNGEDYLAECIESVLSQTYGNFEYIIVNNCSTDRSLEIALSYAKKDNRIRVHNNDQFVGVIENHNLAFRRISQSAKYCKVVSADDYILSECLLRMVEFAEANPSVGIVGSYQLSGDRVRWQGFRYPQNVFSGSEICRKIFLGDDNRFGFGTPTAMMYRADLVRSTEAFYPNSSPHADSSACFKFLQNSSFGFVHQILSYERTHELTQSSASTEIDRYSSAYLSDLIHYGPLYLSQEEYDTLLEQVLKAYHRFLAVDYFVGFRGKEFWDYHRRRLKELGHPLTRFALLEAAVIAISKEILNPQQALKKLRKRIRPKSMNFTFGAVPRISVDSEASLKAANVANSSTVCARRS